MLEDRSPSRLSDGFALGRRVMYIALALALWSVEGLPAASVRSRVSPFGAARLALASTLGARLAVDRDGPAVDGPRGCRADGATPRQLRVGAAR